MTLQKHTLSRFKLLPALFYRDSFLRNDKCNFHSTIATGEEIIQSLISHGRTLSTDFFEGCFETFASVFDLMR